MCDASRGGWYLGFGKSVDGGSTGTSHDANHDYVSYVSDRSCQSAPTSGDAINLGGTDTTNPQNGQWYALFFVTDTGMISMEDVTVTYNLRAEFWAVSDGVQGNVETVSVVWIATDD